ncbi:hypothetical protein RND71_044047 [Anisodus tanguticus]|uniref:Uncharacterized protein n=1 Tax=Anisodus tanguticus TaxID=243964 RepID=A0AAE1QP84_9SOLA|nr:hypothetical protein RND71_044047 [Anisodus tanguticus]
MKEDDVFILFTSESLFWNDSEGHDSDVLTVVLLPPLFSSHQLVTDLSIIIGYTNEMFNNDNARVYQALLQKNLMYLAAIADAQPPVSSNFTAADGFIYYPTGKSDAWQIQAAMLQQQQEPIGKKLPFQLNALPSQEQQQQMLHFQKQYGLGPAGNNPMHQPMRPGLASPGTVDVRGSMHSTS